MFINYNLFGQEDNFYVDNSKIIWQKVFNDSLNIQDLKSDLNLEFTADLRGNLKEFKITGKNLPIVFNNEIIASFLIENREGRYRVTVSNIRIINRGLYDTARLSREDAIEDYYLKKGIFFSDNSWTGKGWVVGRKGLDEYFTNLFKPKTKDSLNEDW